MSILIKGMEMPKSCVNCPIAFFDDEYTILHCPLTAEEFSKNSFIYKRSGNCPLVPVPPHSRLIDADTIGLTNFEIILCKQEKEPYKEALKMVLNKIEKSPTIISEDERRAEE